MTIEYAPERLKCPHCRCSCVELLPWAEPGQRQTMRLQQHMAIDAASMPVSHVAARYGVGWHVVHKAERHALERWEATRSPLPLTMVGIDEKYLGRRNKLEDKFVTIVSDLRNGEPVWIGFGRSEATVRSWLDTLTAEQKAKPGTGGHGHACAIQSRDPQRPRPQARPRSFTDPFHVMKRAGDAIDELRRQVFFRGGEQMRALGRGKRWLFHRALGEVHPLHNVQSSRRCWASTASSPGPIRSLRSFAMCCTPLTR